MISPSVWPASITHDESRMMSPIIRAPNRPAFSFRTRGKAITASCETLAARPVLTPAAYVPPTPTVGARRASPGRAKPMVTSPRLPTRPPPVIARVPRPGKLRRPPGPRKRRRHGRALRLEARRTGLRIEGRENAPMASRRSWKDGIDTDGRYRYRESYPALRAPPSLPASPSLSTRPSSWSFIVVHC